MASNLPISTINADAQLPYRFLKNDNLFFALYP